MLFRSQYQSRLNSLYDMSLKLSTGYADINEKYDAQMKHMNEMRLQLRHFRSLAIDSEAKKIMEEMHDGMVRRYDDFSVDHLLNLSKKISVFTASQADAKETAKPVASTGRSCGVNRCQLSSTGTSIRSTERAATPMSSPACSTSAYIEDRKSVV